MHLTSLVKLPRTHKLKRKKFLHFIVAGFFCLHICAGTSAAQNERWQFVTSDGDYASDWYLDTFSLQRIGSSVAFWQKRIYKDKSHALSRTVLDCSTKIYIITDLLPYASDGTLIRVLKGNDPVNLTPDTIAESYYFAVCLNKSKAGSKSGRETKPGIARQNFDEREVEVITEQVNIRSNASMDGEVIGTLRRGDNPAGNRERIQ